MFECKMCGMCCRDVNRYKEQVYPILKELLGGAIPNFEIKDIDGVCIHLTEDNRCSIYTQRPILCNTEKMFELLSRALGVSKSQLYKAQILSCELNREHNTNLKIQKHEN